MFRRLLPTLLILGLGFIALVWGLASLQRIFIEERDDARAAVKARRTALEQYAKQVLRETLGERLVRLRPAFERALSDPLLSDDGLLLIEVGEQRLPRPIQFRAEDDPQAQQLYDQLTVPGTARAPKGDSPWATRVETYLQFTRAIRAGDKEQVASTFRQILAHRARYAIAAERDIPFMVALLDYFTKHSKPDPALMKQLLRTGIPLGAWGKRAAAGGRSRMRGLQQELLRQRSRFSSGDFSFLAERIATLAEKFDVARTDFVGQAKLSPREPIPAPRRIGSRMLILGARYFAEPIPDGLRGVRVDVPDILSDIGSGMRRRGLMGKGHRVTAALPTEGEVDIDHVKVQVLSPSWAKQERNIRARYRLKTALGIVCGVLALIIVVLAVVFQSRKHRFLELKSDFIASVSHELRTPLSSIRLLAETLERRTAGIDAVGQYPQRIVRDVDGLSFLVENLLSFNRIDKGRWVPRRRRVDVAELIDELRPDIEVSTTKHVELEVTGAEHGEIDADPELIRLLLLNLLRNACLYNNRDPIILRVGLRSTGRGLDVEIQDNGVGIPEGQRDKIFGEFYRAPDQTGRGVRGSGLGLAMCRRIMEMHQGTIRVADSGPGGTTFALRFRN